MRVFFKCLAQESNWGPGPGTLKVFIKKLLRKLLVSFFHIFLFIYFSNGKIEQEHKCFTSFNWRPPSLSDLTPY